MKSLRTGFLLIVSVLCFNSFAMENDAKNTSMLDRALQAMNEVGEWISEIIRFSDDQPKAGDFFLVLVPDMKKMVWATILKDCTMAEKVRRIGQLRRVCKNWNTLLHDPKILKKVLPYFSYQKNSIGKLLTKDSIAPVDCFSLAFFVKHSCQIGLSFRDDFEKVYNRLLNGHGVDHDLQNILISGCSGFGKATRMSFLVEEMKKRGFIVRAFDSSMLGFLRNEEEELNEFFDEVKNLGGKTIIIFNWADSIIGRDAQESLKETFLKCRADYSDLVVILLAESCDIVDNRILEYCNECIKIEAPDFSERRMFLKECFVSYLAMRVHGVPPNASVFSKAYWFGKEESPKLLSCEDEVLLDEVLDKLAKVTEKCECPEIEYYAFHLAREVTFPLTEYLSKQSLYLDRVLREKGL